MAFLVMFRKIIVHTFFVILSRPRLKRQIFTSSFSLHSNRDASRWPFSSSSHEHDMRSVENPGWLFDIGDYTTQLYGDYNKPI